ncbi:hypothetical protein PQR39_35130 [Paraburkholderia sediminicola]|uniref:hypothetical protein n=1 Tax=Paraburkholderia sediminicola TaxID=458836 RepID=UPI0038B87AF8
MKFAFYKAPGTLLDKLIRWWMRGPYAHVEAILDENADGTYTIASAVPGIGVRIAEKQPLPARDWDIVTGPGDATQARAWFEARAGKAYDYLGLLGFVLRPATIDARDKYWCSEACLLSIGYEGAWREDPNSMYSVVTFAATSAARST